jgi:hypothetical protein
MLVEIDPKRFFRWQCTLIAGMLLVHLGFGLLDALGGHDRVYGLARFFDVRREANFPTFVSALTLLAAGIAAAAIAASCRWPRGPYAATWSWITAALLFAAVDEAAQLHELLSPPLHGALGTSGPLYFAWVVPYSVVTVFGTLLAVPALRALGSEPARCALVGMVLMFAGAVGVEMLQGDLWSRAGPASSQTLLNFGLATSEETLELLGGAYLLRGLLVGLSARLGGQPVRLRLG